MLNSPTKIVLPINSYKRMVQYDQYYETIGRTKGRSENSVPDMQHVIRMDMERLKTNKVYDRKLNHDLTGRRGLNWQCKQELQRLRSDERDIERDLVRLNRVIAKRTLLPTISKSPSLYHTPRLSSIAEEHSPLPLIEKPRSRSSANQIIPIQKRSSIGKRNSNIGNHQRLRRNSFQHDIAKTSDDRSYFQQHAQTINQEKRLIEQKLKEFLH